MNFYGEHQFQFKGGFNLVLGSGGSGKTNLANAFKFAVLGQTEFPHDDLINLQHRQECLEKRRRAFCRVEAAVQHRGRGYLVKSELSLTGEGEIRQSTSVPLELDKIMTPKNFNLIYLESNLEKSVSEEKSKSPVSERTKDKAAKLLGMNVKLGIKMGIIDGVPGLLTGKNTEDFLNFVRTVGLDQTIFMVKYRDQAGPLMKKTEDTLLIHLDD
jgi:energy-coupling factor transporter ATP-binding protein EcfA2